MNCKWLIIKWAQLGSNQRPPDYESPLFDILSALKKSFIRYIIRFEKVGLFELSSTLTEIYVYIPV
jgi:hypothetical protein